MIIAPFEASKVKLERAARHIEELQNAISVYFAEKPCSLIVEEFDGMPQHLPCQAWTTRVRTPVPSQLAPIIGDVVHNLRSSLDILACDLVRVQGKSPKQVHFPFCDRAEDLPEAIKRRHLHRAGDDVVDAIKKLKPYREGNAALRLIHDMDIADKHQALLPVLGAASVPLGPLLGAPANFAAQEWQSLIQDGHKVIMIPEQLSPVRLGAELPARWFLAFGDQAGSGSVPVIECLQELAKTANDVFLTLTTLRPNAAFPTAAP